MLNAIKRIVFPLVLSFRFPTAIQFSAVYFARYRRGLSIYKKFRKQYGNGAICICPYKGTGDVYLTAAYFKDSEDDKKESFLCHRRIEQKNSRAFSSERPRIEFHRKTY